MGRSVFGKPLETRLAKNHDSTDIVTGVRRIFLTLSIG